MQQPHPVIDEARPGPRSRLNRSRRNTELPLTHVPQRDGPHREQLRACRALGTGFPKDRLLLLLLVVVVAENKQTSEWLELHHQQAASVTNGTEVPLPGEHYLHHTHAGEMAEGVGSGRRGGDRVRAVREGIKRAPAVLPPPARIAVTQAHGATAALNSPKAGH